MPSTSQSTLRSRVGDRVEWTIWYIFALLFTIWVGMIGCTKKVAEVPPKLPETHEITELRAATGTLYSMDKFGDYEMACTATVVGQTTDGYILLTAAHCIDALAQPFVSFDDGPEITMYRADLIDMGMEKQGDDWAILMIKTRKRIPAICIGKSSELQPRDPLTSVACSLGLGKTEVDGRVELPQIQRPMINPNLGADWTDCILVDINISPGASGSVVYSTRLRAAVGIIIGTIGDKHVVVLPIERVRFPS